MHNAHYTPEYKRNAPKAFLHLLIYVLNSKGAGWLRNKKVSELTYVFFIFDNFLHL